MTQVEKVLAQELVEHINTCPNEIHKFERSEGCTNVCDGVEFEDCWIEWAKGSPKKWPGMIKITDPDV